MNFSKRSQTSQTSVQCTEVPHKTTSQQATQGHTMLAKSPAIELSEAAMGITCLEVHDGGASTYPDSEGMTDWRRC